MSDYVNPKGSVSTLKQKLLEALQTTVSTPGNETSGQVGEQKESSLESIRLESRSSETVLRQGESVYSRLVVEETLDSEESLPEELRESRARLLSELQQVQRTQGGFEGEAAKKNKIDGTLSMRGVVPDAQTETLHPAGAPSSSYQATHIKSNSVISGGSMADLSGYKDLSKAPISFGDDDLPMSTITSDSIYERAHVGQQMGVAQQFSAQQYSAQQHFAQEVAGQEVDTEFSGNVKTLIRLVNELPEGVTKQTGAQIIRLTMEAMGISMEDVLSEAQSAQSEMLDAVRANIKKIEEYKTVIRKLETDIKYYQGKANELSEIIDLFILSNTSSGNKLPIPEDLTH